MGLDIRIPLGLIFLIIGGIMSLFGLITRGSATLYETFARRQPEPHLGPAHVRLRRSSCSSWASARNGRTIP